MGFRSFLRFVADWLDRTFPVKVTVTLKDYETLKNDVEALKNKPEPISVARLKEIQDEINKFNVALGFGGMGVINSQMKAFQR